LPERVRDGRVVVAHPQIPLMPPRRSLEPVLEPLESVPVALDQDSQGAVALPRGVQQFLAGRGVGAWGAAPIPLHAHASRTFTALNRMLCWPPRTSSSPPRGLAPRNHVVRSRGAVVNRKPVKTSGQRDGSRRPPGTASARRSRAAVSGLRSAGLPPRV